MSRSVTGTGLAVRIAPFVAVGALLVACGGTTAPARAGLPREAATRTPATVGPGDARSAADLLAAARAAFAAAPSVHVMGTLVPSGRSVKVDLRLKGEAGGTATITPSSSSPSHAPEVRVIRIRDVAWVTGNLAFWQDVTGDDAQARAKMGSWVKVPARQGNFGEYVQYTWPETVTALLPTPDRPATVADRVSIDGQPAVYLKVGDATQYTVAEGSARPLQLQGLLTNELVAYLNFSGYGAEVPLRAPDGRTVDGGGGAGS